jgi:hypothetical protein
LTPRARRRAIAVPQCEGAWPAAAIGQAGVVAKMRERGHPLQEIRKATEEGRLASGFLDELFGGELSAVDAVARSGEVTLKGFSESTEGFAARQHGEESE